MTVALPTADDTRALGARLGAVLRAGDLVILTGRLGAGKTTLVQGIGDGLDVEGHIASPTFVIARVHPSRVPGRPTLVHVDAYRLGSLAEVEDLDLEVEAEDAATVVEWGHGLVEQLADSRLEIVLERSADTDERSATLTAYGDDWVRRIAELA
jgi:tRNA threonylcarbamoyladenosine biosynthesis protein TsaE